MGALHDYDKILTRLTIILQRLYEGETLGVSELAEEFNVSTKTIQRDFNERLLRFPIHKEGRKWRMEKGHSIEKNRSIEEELILDVLGEIANGVGEIFGSKTKNLFSKLQNSNENPIYSKIPIEDITGKADLFRLLQDAIAHQKSIGFSYNQKNRVVHPYKIVSFEGYWYLYGKEVESDKLKTYYLKEINTPKMLDSTYHIDEDAYTKLKYAINTWFEPNNELFEATLLATKEIAKYFYRRPLSEDQLILPQANGDIVIKLKATASNEILHEVKKWMPNLLVLEPQELKEDSKKMAEEFLKWALKPTGIEP